MTKTHFPLCLLVFGVFLMVPFSWEHSQLCDFGLVLSL